MIKSILHTLLLVVPFLLRAQGEKETTWKKEKDYLEYKKTDKYEGPEDWYGSYPADMKSEDNSNGANSGNGNQGYQGIQYTPQQIQKDRKKRYRGFDRGGGQGTVPYDPKVKDPEPIEIPDIDAPDIDLPDVDLPTPSISAGVWKVLLFILIGAAIFMIAYFLIKNKKAPNARVVIDVEDDWNPEVISKTELELRLESAVLDENYRECVRIYFTFILKELIRKSWIYWKREKTNYHYVLEMHKRENASHFNECVRVYDIVWYGDYQIDKEIFELLQPTFKNYYKSLDPVNE
ncbi:MAG: hypothetical protein QNL61_04215 [Crocinitomicaceae bacterium]